MEKIAVTRLQATECSGFPATSRTHKRPGRSPLEPHRGFRILASRAVRE